LQDRSLHDRSAVRTCRQLRGALAMLIVTLACSVSDAGCTSASRTRGPQWASQVTPVTPRRTPPSKIGPDAPRQEDRPAVSARTGTLAPRREVITSQDMSSPHTPATRPRAADPTASKEHSESPVMTVTTTVERGSQEVEQIRLFPFLIGFVIAAAAVGIFALVWRGRVKAR
jgi:hypothetical protein